MYCTGGRGDRRCCTKVGWGIELRGKGRQKKGEDEEQERE